jgi:hypothetical protein
VRPVTEVLADGVAEGGRFLRQPRRPVQLDHEGERRVPPRLAGGFDDELLGVRVQVPLPERGRVDGVEELLQLGDVDPDHLAALRERIAGTSRHRKRP